jgi:hypothetical protein
MPVAIPDKNNFVSVSGSKSLSLGLIADDQSAQSVSDSPSPFYFSIPRDTTQPLPEFDILESTDYQESNNTHDNYTISENKKALNILKLNGFIIPKNNVSIHYHIRPNSFSYKSVGYFVALKFGGNTYLNSTYQSFDLWNIFCPDSK